MTKLYLSIVVFVAGAAVLALEIAGTRILAPFYGVSLFLWSALITVTLAALSVGYAVGGRLADRGPRLSRLCYALGGAGVWLLVLPFVRTPLLRLTEPFGLRPAVLLAATLLFGPPLALLGMVAPYAVRLRAASLDEVGRTAGDLYALSTVGSVLAALATGFILIPSVGVARLTALIGASLLLTALGGLLVARRLDARSVLVAGGVLSGLLAVAILGARADAPPGLVAVAHSPHAELRVVDADGVRHLLIDGGVHSMVDLETKQPLFPYVHVLDVVRHLFAEPGELLLIGLGGGSVAVEFARQGWQVDAVEIDSAVTKLARLHFGLEAGSANVMHMDGRQFLLSSDNRYDAIVVDAFGSGSIPYHLTTREAFALMAAHLTPGGVLALNVESIGWHDLIVRALAVTLRQELATVLALPIAEPPNTLGNVVLVAADRELELIEELPPTLDRFSDAYHKNHAWDNRFEPEADGAPVLSDDLNPVDVWSERINLAEREELHAYFAEGLSW